MKGYHLIIFLIAIFSLPLLAQETWTTSKIGTYNGYDYELWSENNAGSTTMKLTGDNGSGANAVGGTFEATWSKTINILFRSGKKFTGTTNPTGKSAAEHGNITIDFAATWSSSDNVKMLGVYGWAFFKQASRPTRDENGTNRQYSDQIEYYIIQERGSYNPATGGTNSKKYGEATIDGIVYEFYVADRIQKWALTGNGDVNFKQYFSVPKSTSSHRTSGLITVSKHFEEWAKVGMIMDGPLYEVALKVESYTGANSNATGNAKITKNILTIGGTIPEGNYTLTTTASPTVGGTVTKTPNSTSYAPNTNISVKATAATGWEFVGWEGDTAATTATTTITMNKDKSVTAKFRPTVDGTENLIKDGNFPGSGLTANWSLHQGQYYGNSAATSNVSNGKATINITTAGAETYQPQFVQQNISLEEGLKYRLTFTASAASERSINVILQQNGGDYVSYATKDFDLTPAPETYTLEFTMNNPSDPAAQLAFNLGGSGVMSSVTISDVALIYILSDPSGISKRVHRVFDNDRLRANILPNAVNVIFKAVQSGKAELKLYNLKGNLISAVLLQTSAGEFYAHTFNPKKLPGGIYIVHLHSGREVQEIKLVVPK